MQHEITVPSQLLDEHGRLIQQGWARQPLLDCNLENVSFYAVKPLQFLRVKRWDYYAAFTPTHFFSATVADIGYVGNVFVYLIEFESKWFHEESLLIPLARGVSLPRNSTEGDVVFDNGQARLEFLLGEDTRRVVVNWPAFDHGKGITADVVLHCPPDHESMVSALPFSDKRFFYTRKTNSLPAEGWITHGDRRIEVAREVSLGGMDWGRGVWEYTSFWNWASTSAYLPDGRRFGLNLGNEVGDPCPATDNAFFLDGRIHKLGRVPFEYDPSDYMKPWRFVAEDGRIELEFVPFLERIAKTNLVILSSEVHQMFGQYSGTVVTDQGEKIAIKNVIGFAEEHHARW